MTAQRHRDASGSLRIAVFLLFAFLPVSMPAHLVVNHFLGRTWCWYSAFLSPESILTVLLLVLVVASPSARRRAKARLSPTETGGRPLLAWFMALGALIVAWTSLSAVLQASHADFWIQRLLVGWVFPMAMILAFLGVEGSQGLHAAWKGLAVGSTLLLLAALVLYFVSFGFPGNFQELVFRNRTSRIHEGLRGGIYFGELTLGGVNDIAVFFAVGTALAWGAFVSSRSSKSSRVAAIWLAGALALEYLCYSRGAILSMGAAAFVFFVTAVRRRQARSLVPPLVFGAFVLCALAPTGAFEYWRLQLLGAHGTSAEFRLSLWQGALRADPEGHRFEQEGSAAITERMHAAVLETGVGRTAAPAGPEQARATQDAFAALRKRIAERSGSWPRRLLLGYGPGNFGIVQGMTYEAGTHNLFVDALATTGVPGFGLIAALWLLLFFVSGRALASRPFQRAVDGRLVCVTSLSLFSAVLTMLLCAVLVNVRVDNLGTSLFGAVLWLLIATSCEADRLRREDEGLDIA